MRVDERERDESGEDGQRNQRADGYLAMKQTIHALLPIILWMAATHD